jgi:hypothetical protein
MEEGKRFSLIYLERSAPVRDSARFRNRLAAYYWDNLYGDYKEKIRRVIQKEIGAEIPVNKTVGYSVPDFFKKNELRDVLDSITLIYQVVIRSGYPSRAENWKKSICYIERS